MVCMSNDTKPTPLDQPVVVPVAGVSYRQNIVRQLNENDRVILRRDRENEFDENAVAFYTLDGDHFGFLPKGVAEKFKDYPEERWGGRISEVLPGQTWGLRVQVTHSNIPDYPVKPKSVSFIDPVEITEEDAPAGVDAESIKVFSKSGRFLGVTQCWEEGSKTVAVQIDGEDHLYPASVVTVKE